MISFGLDEDQLLIQDTVRKLALGELRPRLRELEQAGVPAELRRKFHELGLGLLDLPEALGGQGQSLVTAALVHEELAYGDPGAAVALWAPHLAAQALFCLGDEAQQRRLLARFAAPDGYDRLGALAYAEREALLEGFRTTARRDGADWVLDGRKAFVVNGGRAALHVVFAQLAGTTGWPGAAAFVVEAGNPGLREGARHQLLGLEAVHAAEVILDGCRVPEANRLAHGDFAAGTARLFARAALANAARQVGLARAAYEFALEYTQERRAFGKPVAHFQSIAFTLAELATDVEAARWMVWRGARELDRGAPGVAVAEAIVQANQAAWRCADDGVQLLGGAGYVQDYPSEKWLRDAKALALFGPPTETALEAIWSRELGQPLAGLLPTAAIQPFFT